MRRASSPARLTVVGAGAWGTVLAILLARNGHSVKLWVRREELADSIRRNRENVARLPGIALPAEIDISTELETATGESDATFVAVPSKVLPEISARFGDVPAIVSCSKGLARPGLTRLSEVIGRIHPSSQTAVLSGPNLASEIAAGLPAAAVAASVDGKLAERVQGWLQSPAFRVYTSPDPTGVEVGGSLKNVIALAAGMSDGLGLGDNAKASIVTRGLVELVRVGVELGARRETLYGLAGLGDLIATCSSPGSRNHMAGVRITAGATAEELDADGLTAEGVPTVRAAYEFAAERNLELPITAEVYRVVFERKDPRRALDDLMSRAKRSEW
ncbi:MAG: NAD(P)H-dependent glycerol-3-phosphate dehydrogenase [Trueperaceae bacterium]